MANSPKVQTAGSEAATVTDEDECDIFPAPPYAEVTIASAARAERPDKPFDFIASLRSSSPSAPVPPAPADSAADVPAGRKAAMSASGDTDALRARFAAASSSSSASVGAGGAATAAGEEDSDKVPFKLFCDRYSICPLLCREATVRRIAEFMR